MAQPIFLKFCEVLRLAPRFARYVPGSRLCQILKNWQNKFQIIYYLYLMYTCIYYNLQFCIILVRLFPILVRCVIWHSVRKGGGGCSNRAKISFMKDFDQRFSTIDSTLLIVYYDICGIWSFWIDWMTWQLYHDAKIDLKFYATLMLMWQ